MEGGCFEQTVKLCVTQSVQVKLCVAQQRLGKKPEPGFEQAAKLCATKSVLAKLCVTYEALCCTIGTRGSSVSQNSQGKSRNQVLNKQKSSVLHMKLCATQSGLGKLCVSKQPGKKPEPGFEQAGKLCATQSGQVKLCVTKGLGKKPESGFEQAGKLCATQSGQAKLCVTY